MPDPYDPSEPFSKRNTSFVDYRDYANYLAKADSKKTKWDYSSYAMKLGAISAHPKQSVAVTNETNTETANTTKTVVANETKQVSANETKKVSANETKQVLANETK